ncbi:GNAT family N-acetyltransferase [Mediterraneibacter glycyrrhizinilyticus]|uniref:GNAT family N-acetyltransferase n=1 Tax=Mediterraneibacter glycyrrhizinilyticus TaxID=342942 RepID=UPI0019603CDD|nr:GNAT family N-acetyltransferase [Mediterraneibacter glycyrrhizinilyticus]
MFTIRPYREGDAEGCGQCFYEGFFTCPIDGNDRILLRDYAQVLIEKCSFAYVAETLDHQIVGFISGNYGKGFRPMKTDPDRCKRHYIAWCQMFLKFYLKGYRLSEIFQKQLDDFILQAREREEKFFDGCDLELAALTSRKDYRKGLGTALVSRFMDRAVADGARNVRLLTNTLASWEFYEKIGFTKMLEKPFSDGSGQKTIIYGYSPGREKNEMNRQQI